MKMLRKISILLIAALMLLGGFGLTGCKPKPVNSIEYYLDFSLPTDMVVLYNYQPSGFIQGGRQPQYTVFQLQERPNTFLLDNAFVMGVTPEEIPSDWLYAVYERVVEKDYHPPWDEEFMWLRSHPVNLIYFEAQKRLIVIIEPN